MRPFEQFLARNSFKFTYKRSVWVRIRFFLLLTAAFPQPLSPPIFPWDSVQTYLVIWPSFTTSDQITTIRLVSVVLEDGYTRAAERSYRREDKDIYYHG